MTDILEARIQELMEISKATVPDTPEWYIRMCVEAYIREQEPELIVGLNGVEITDDNSSDNEAVTETVPVS